MTEQPTRAPTVDEAVALLLMPATKRYRRRCITHWKNLCGEPFANMVVRQFRVKARGRKGKRFDQ